MGSDSAQPLLVTSEVAFFPFCLETRMAWGSGVSTGLLKKGMTILVVFEEIYPKSVRPRIIIILPARTGRSATTLSAYWPSAFGDCAIHLSWSGLYRRIFSPCRRPVPWIDSWSQASLLTSFFAWQSEPPYHYCLLDGCSYPPSLRVPLRGVHSPKLLLRPGSQRIRFPLFLVRQAEHFSAVSLMTFIPLWWPCCRLNTTIDATSMLNH